MSTDGSRLVYAKGGLVANVWRVPILADRRATWADTEQITFDEAFIEFLDVSPDGERLLISSDRRGNTDLWVLPSSGGDMRQLTTEPTPDWGPRWSPDGTEIVFYAYRSGIRDIWTMPAGGGPTRRITHNELNDWIPSWSPDGREIVFWENTNGLWVIPAEGGEPRQVTSVGERPDWSPDGEWISFWASDINGGPGRLRPSGADATPLPVSGGQHFRWSPDSKDVYFTARGNLWSLSIESGLERQLTDLAGKRGTTTPYTIDTDGEYVYFTWRDDLGDIWVMDVVQ